MTSRWLKVATLSARQAIICISDDIPRGWEFVHERLRDRARTRHFTGPGVQALSGQRAGQMPDRYELETAEVFAKPVAQATLRQVHVLTQPKLA